jgi:dipeptidyl-peptidase 4
VGVHNVTNRADSKSKFVDIHHISLGETKWVSTMFYVLERKMSRARQLLPIWLLLLIGQFAFLICRPALSDKPAKRFFSYEQAFGDSEEGGDAALSAGVLKQLPKITRWLDDENYLEMRSDPGSGRKGMYAVRAENGNARIYRDYSEMQRDLPAGISAENPDASSLDLNRFIFILDGDLYFYELQRKKCRQITATPGKEQNPEFSPDGKWVAYTRDHDLFAFDLENALEHRCTTDGSNAVYNGWGSWVYYEEILGRPSEYAAFWWSPNSARLAFMRFDDSPVPISRIFSTDKQRAEPELQRYPKAGDPNPYVAVCVASVADGGVQWMDFPDKADHYLAWPFWTPDSRTLTVQWMNREQDTVRIYNCDPGTGKKSLVHEERRSTWINFFKDLHCLKNGSGFLLRSDADGWDHLYYYSNDGKLEKRLTSGNWRVSAIERIDESGGYVYFTGQPQDSWDSCLMRVKLDGSGLEQLTRSPGTHQTMVSPAGKYFIDTVSMIASPPMMRLYRCDGTLVRILDESRTPTMDEYSWGKTELFTIPSGDGFDLPAYWVLPVDFNENKQYPVIFNIYGGPDYRTVENKWLGLRPHYWAQEGIITIGIDHRGSGHFGRKGMEFLYRNLGKWEMVDLAAAVEWLRKKPFVAKDKIGITGSSYGGYLAMMALTFDSDYFNYAVATSPVTDWRLYDSVYTERYMDSPANNPEGYRNSAVLTWINRYKGFLRLNHGIADDNVHMQNTTQIVDWLAGNNKRFELMLYPYSLHEISQREPLLRETHDFWVRNLLNGNLPMRPVSDRKD